MCGIIGVLGLSDKSMVREMSNNLIHRGPDDVAFYVDESISLGHRRLSIIDVAGGRQPLHNEDHNIWFIGNGEIYNYKALRTRLEQRGHSFATNSDNEIPIHLYEEFGHNCVDHLRGMFAFAIWDSKKKRLFLARDRLGIKPLYYLQLEDQFIFASEIKALFQHPDVRVEIDPKALYEFLIFRYVPGPITLFNGIKKLQPGHTLMIDSKESRTLPYWRFGFTGKGIHKEESTIDTIESLLKESIEMRLMSEVPLGVYLSGGTDSSAVVALMSQAAIEPIKTFSVGFSDEQFNELPYAKIVAEHFGTDHHELMVEPDAAAILPKIVWHFDEPVADPAAVPTFLLSEFAKKRVTVVLTGEGGDELFAGYEQYKIMKRVERYRRFLPQPILNLMAACFCSLPRSMMNRFFVYTSRLGDKGLERFRTFIRAGKDVGRGYLAIVSIFSEMEAKDAMSFPDAKESVRPYVAELLNKEYFNGNRANDLLSSLLLLESEKQLPDNLLMKVDKMTMAHSIEARVPLLDHRIAEFAMKLQSDMKIHNGIDKYIFRRTINRYLPTEIVQRRKARFFVPIDKWLSGEFGYMAKELLYGSDLIKKEYLDRLYKGFSRSELYYSRQIWSLINLELWNRIFVKGDVRNPKLSMDKLLAMRSSF